MLRVKQESGDQVMNNLLAETGQVNSSVSMKD